MSSLNTELDLILRLMKGEEDITKMGYVGFRLRGLRARYKNDPVRMICEQLAYLKKQFPEASI